MKSFRTRSVAALTAILLSGIVTTPVSTAPVSEGGFLETVLSNSAEREGDYDALAASWLEAAESHRDDPRLELLFRRLRVIEPRLREPSSMLAPLERLASEVLRGEPQEVARGLLARLYSRAGRIDDLDELLKRRGYLGSFHLIGPFGKGSSQGLLKAFPPETKVDFGKSYQDGWQELRWRRWIGERPKTSISPLSQVYPSRGIVYLLSQVLSEQESGARLHVESSGRSVIWVNGFKVYDDAIRTEFLPARRVVDIKISKGWNRVLVKTSASFSLRLTDGENNPLVVTASSGDELHEGPGLDIDPAGGSLGLAPDSSTLWAARLSGMPPVGDSAEEKRARALEHVGLAILYRLNQLGPWAVEQIDQALELAPEDPFILNQAGRAFRDASYLPTNISKNRAQSAWEKALVSDPDFLPAYVHVARYELADEKTAEAAKTLQKALSRNPNFYYGLLNLHRVYDARDWGADARRVLRDIEKISSESLLPPLELAQYYNLHDNAQRATELYLRAARIHKGQTSILASLAQIELEAGRPEKALTYMESIREIRPDRFGSYQQIAAVHALQGNDDLAIKTLTTWRDRAPWNPAVHRALAERLLAAGQADRAEESERQALALAPGNLKLRGYLARNDEKATDFWKPYDERLEDWVGRVPSSGPLVDKSGAISVLDLMVTKVYEDGSQRSYIHQAFRLLSEEAKDSLAKVQTPGQILGLRTLTADGHSLEPVAALGRSQYVLPGVKPGVFTEYSYIVEQSEVAGRPFTAGSFYFQDFTFSQSFLLSRFVLIVPEGFNSAIIESQLEGSDEVDLAHVEKTETELPGGGRVLVYESRKAARLDRERLMPTSAEYIPNVSVVRDLDWKDVATELRLRANYAAMQTPEIAKAAARLTDGTDDPLEKAKKIYEFVNEHVPSQSGSRTAVRVLLEKSGDRTILFKALLDASGVPSRWALLRQPEVMLPRTDWARPQPSMFGFRHLLVEIDGAEYWVNLSGRNTPFGKLPEYLAGGSAFLLDSHGHSIRRLASTEPEDYATVTTIDGKLVENAAADIQFRMDMKSASAYASKDRFKTLQTFQKNLMGRQMANQFYPGAQVKKVDFAGLEDPDKPLSLIFDLKAPRILRSSGDDLLLKVVQRSLQLVRSYGGAAERKHPYHLRNRVAIRDHVRIEIGPYRIRKLPEDVALVSELGIYSLSFKEEGGALSIERRFSLDPGRISAESFSTFLRFCELVDEAEGTAVIFRPRN